MNEWMKNEWKNGKNLNVILIWAKYFFELMFSKQTKWTRKNKTTTHEKQQIQCLFTMYTWIDLCCSYAVDIDSVLVRQSIIIRDCLWVLVVVVVFSFVLFFFHAFARIFLTVFFFQLYKLGAFNIFFIVFHLVFTSVPHTCSMLFGNARIHRGLCFLFLFLMWSFSIYFVSPSHPLSRPPSPSLSLTLQSSFSFFIFLFLPYFNEFVADFEASNTDTQPYHIPHKIIIVIETQFIYIHI